MCKSALKVPKRLANSKKITFNRVSCRTSKGVVLALIYNVWCDII
jgi:hypothetical protein